MKRLDQAAIAALKSILETQPTTEAKVSFAWTIAAGPTLARAATVTWSETGTLRVVARTEAWRQELARARPLIARRVADLVGEDVVRRIAIDVVRDERLVSNVVPPFAQVTSPMREAVIVSATRTPTGKFLGSLKGFSATDLGAMAVREAVKRAGVDPASVDECILGNVVSAGLGQAPARQAALRGGLDPRVAALTINKVCGSGLKAVMLATQAIALGDADIVVAGGMESMSNCPYLLPGARDGLRMGDAKLVDSMVHDGLWDSFHDIHMGLTGEHVAERYKVTREEQDRYAVESHRRAAAATRAGWFKDEILPVSIPGNRARRSSIATSRSARTRAQKRWRA